MDNRQVRSTRAWHVGIDIGKRRDFTAVSIARVHDRRSPFGGTRPETAYEIDMLERIKLGLNFMDQVNLLHTVVLGLLERVMSERGSSSGINFEGPGAGAARPVPPIRIYCDETGVGDGVADGLERLLRRDRQTAGIDLTRVRWTAGQRLTRRWEDGAMRILVGKELLVRELLNTVLSGRVKLAAKLEGRLNIEEEFRTYEAHMREEDGHTSYGAAGSGAHDDLISAMILSILEDPRDYTTSTQSYTY